jgi:hypothetical protein
MNTGQPSPHIGEMKGSAELFGDLRAMSGVIGILAVKTAERERMIALSGG